MPPGAGLPVDDFQPGGLSFQALGGKRDLAHFRAVAAGRAGHRFSIHQQAQPGSLVRAAADPDADVFPADDKLPAQETAGGAVFFNDLRSRRAGVGVDHPFPRTHDLTLETRYFTSLQRPAAEGRALHAPAFVTGPVPVLENDVLPASGFGGERSHGPAQESEMLGPGSLHLPPAGQLPVVLAHRVFQAPFQQNLQLALRLVAELIGKNRGGKRRVVQLQRDERRKRLEHDLHRAIRIGKIHPADRIPPGEHDLGKAAGVQLAGNTVHREREALLDRGIGGRRLHIVRTIADPHGLPAVFDRLVHDALVAAVENLPHPQPAIAGKVNHAAGQPAHRHADGFQVPPAVALRHAPPGERGQPLRGELFIRSDDAGHSLERPGPRPLPDEGPEEQRGSGKAEEIAAVGGGVGHGGGEQ